MRKSDGLKKETRRFALSLALAAVMHGVMIASVLWFQLFFPSRQPPMKVVTVSLVSLPGPGSGPAPPAEASKGAQLPAAQPETKPPEPAPQQKLPEPKPQKQVSKVPLPEPRQSPAKKIPTEPAKPSSAQQLAEALEKLKKNVKPDKPSAQGNPSGDLKGALAQLQKKVASQGSGSTSGGGGNLYGGGGGGGASDPYKVKIAGIIQQNWQFSSQMLRSTAGMEVYVAINILPNGSIRQIKFDKKAPSEYLNNSVKNALEKSNPLPALPRESGSRDIWIGFVFTPEGGITQ